MSSKSELVSTQFKNKIDAYHHVPEEYQDDVRRTVESLGRKIQRYEIELTKNFPEGKSFYKIEIQGIESDKIVRIELSFRITKEKTALKVDLMFSKSEKCKLPVSRNKVEVSELCLNREQFFSKIVEQLKELNPDKQVPCANAVRRVITASFFDGLPLSMHQRVGLRHFKVTSMTRQSLQNGADNFEQLTFKTGLKHNPDNPSQSLLFEKSKKECDRSQIDQMNFAEMERMFEIQEPYSYQCVNELARIAIRVDGVIGSKKTASMSASAAAKPLPTATDRARGVLRTIQDNINRHSALIFSKLPNGTSLCKVQIDGVMENKNTRVELWMLFVKDGETVTAEAVFSQIDLSKLIPENAATNSNRLRFNEKKFNLKIEAQIENLEFSKHVPEVVAVEKVMRDTICQGVSASIYEELIPAKMEFLVKSCLDVEVRRGFSIPIFQELSFQVLINPENFSSKFEKIGKGLAKSSPHSEDKLLDFQIEKELSDPSIESRFDQMLAAFFEQKSTDTRENELVSLVVRAKVNL